MAEKPAAGSSDSGGQTAPDDTFTSLLQATEDRYRNREAARAASRVKLDEGRILDADTPARVARRLGRLRAAAGDPGAAEADGIAGAAILPPPEPGLLERIIGGSDLIGVSFLELGLLISRTVGRIHIRNGAGSTIGYGTGFMVSPRLLLTNNHVLDRPETASFGQVEFEYRLGIDGRPAPSVCFGLEPDRLFLTDAGLDYTLVAVQERLPDGRTPAVFGWNRMIEDEGKIIIGEYVNIIQHPNGEPKQLALRENRLEDVLEQWLHYHTDTAPGSSGSPVFNDQWEIVALHHSGVPRRDEQNRILARDGQVWLPEMGEHRIDWIANEGARASRIVRHIRAQPLAGAAAQLRDEMLATSAPPPERSVSISPRPPVRRPEPPEPPAPDAPGVTITIPIQVTVRLGQPDQSGSASVTVSVPGGAAAPPALPDAGLADALAALADAGSRPYFDAAADIAARDAYYAGVEMTLDPAALYRRLSALLGDTHAFRPPYKPARYVYPWVDWHPDRKLRSVYSDIAYEPEAFIREDFRIATERVARTRELLAAETSADPVVLAEAIDLLEAALPYNCEHSVPQSWFAKKEPMRGDLHHLFACESGCNSFRGNHAYWDFPDFEEAIRSDCGRREENRFEPSSPAGKGVVARATFYFLLRYPGEIAAAGGELDVERLPVLLAWNRQSPPGEYERHRNQAIFEIQGNRNPLIDHPEWAERIDFAAGFGS